MPLNTDLNLVVSISYGDCSLVDVIQLCKQRCHLGRAKVLVTSIGMYIGHGTKRRGIPNRWGIQEFLVALDVYVRVT